MISPTWLWNHLEPDFKAELLAGKHQEFPALRQLTIDGSVADAEAFALREACTDIAFGRSPRMD